MDVVSSEIEIQTCLAVLVLCLPRVRLHEHRNVLGEEDRLDGFLAKSLRCQDGQECTMDLVTWSCPLGLLEAFVSCVERTGSVTKI